MAPRLATAVASRHLTGSRGFDDAVYFGTPVRLVDGLLPCRHFGLIQLPAAPLALAPIAAAGFLLPRPPCSWPPHRGS